MRTTSLESPNLRVWRVGSVLAVTRGVGTGAVTGGRTPTAQRTWTRADEIEPPRVMLFQECPSSKGDIVMRIHRLVRGLCAAALALSLSLAPLGTTSHAGIGEGSITLNNAYIGLFGTGNVYFWPETSSNAPACVANYNRDGKSHRFVFNLNSHEGKAYFQLLMTAKLVGKKLVVMGTGACEIASDTESVASMRFLD